MPRWKSLPAHSNSPRPSASWSAPISSTNTRSRRPPCSIRASCASRISRARPPAAPLHPQPARRGRRPYLVADLSVRADRRRRQRHGRSVARLASVPEIQSERRAAGRRRNRSRLLADERHQRTGDLSRSPKPSRTASRMPGSSSSTTAAKDIYYATYTAYSGSNPLGTDRDDGFPVVPPVPAARPRRRATRAWPCSRAGSMGDTP